MPGGRTPPRGMAVTLRRRLCRSAAALGAHHTIERPAFIIGCGRSGTTVLGSALGRHRDIAYLNEPRHLWAAAYPETDIWSPRATDHGGRLDLDRSDTDPTRSRRLHDLFYCETRALDAPVLTEKLPANNFRLSFVDAIFPDARYIHILRNGLEVARSIERMADDDAWYGDGDYKWARLVEYCRARDDCRELPDLCSTDFLKGLLEWRVSVDAALAFLKGVEGRSLELTYAELLDEPVGTLDRIISFLGLEPDESVSRFASEQMARRTARIEPRPLTPPEERIAGQLLRRLGYSSD
ncbi:MAG: hypothetical protein GF405_03590 [Candidatus Eisenbacteria bacterium]|nr:hypothetical protein [Candidatus Eisenbacteria bacterium]